MALAMPSGWLIYHFRSLGNEGLFNDSKPFPPYRSFLTGKV